MQRAEDGSRRRREILQLRDVDREQQQVVERGDGFDASSGASRVTSVPGSSGRNVERMHRNAERDCRSDGAGVEDLAPKCASSWASS